MGDRVITLVRVYMFGVTVLLGLTRRGTIPIVAFPSLQEFAKLIKTVAAGGSSASTRRPHRLSVGIDAMRRQAAGPFLAICVSFCVGCEQGVIPPVM